MTNIIEQITLANENGLPLELLKTITKEPSIENAIYSFVEMVEKSGLSVEQTALNEAIEQGLVLEHDTDDNVGDYIWVEPLNEWIKF